MNKVFSFIFFFFLSSSVNAQTIEFIVSASAGGPDDRISRELAKIITPQLNANIVVINKPGGAHTVAYQYVLQSKNPTLIVSTSAIENHSVYDQLTPIREIGKFSMYIFAHQNSSISNYTDMIRISESKEILFGNSGPNTFSNAGMEFVCRFPVRCLPVLYRSGADGILGILSGQIDLYSLVSYGVRGFIDNPRLKIVHKIYLPKNYIILFSKNINNNTINEITKILDLKLSDNFLEEMKLERD